MQTSRRVLSLLMVAALLLGAQASFAETSLPLDKIELPPGFAIELVARVPNARAMAWGEQRTLFVGSMQAGKVYALTLHAGSAAQIYTIASGLQMPVGVAFRNG